MTTTLTAPPRHPRPLDEALTDREIEVLGHIAEGLTIAQTAALMWLGAETVKSHMLHVRAALGARNAAHAVAIGFTVGLLRPRREDR